MIIKIIIIYYTIIFINGNFKINKIYIIFIIYKYIKLYILMTKLITIF